MRIKVNKIRCNKCGEIIESKSVHDFKFCQCGAVAVDGGHDYLRRYYKEEGCYTDTSIISPKKMSKIRRKSCLAASRGECHAQWQRPLHREKDFRDACPQQGFR